MTDNFDKSAILDSFLDEVNAYLPDIESNLDRLQQNPADTEALEETYRRAHTIGGSAAMMDFEALAHVARGVEDILGDAMDRGEHLSPATIALLRRSHARLVRLVEQIRTGADDMLVVAEDDADHAAWRGAGSNPGVNGSLAAMAGPGMSSPAAGGALPTGTGPLPVPDWLAAFAGGPGAPAAPGVGGAPSQPSGPLPAAPGADPWAASISNLPTGREPVVPLQAPKVTAPGVGGDAAWSNPPGGPWQASQPPAPGAWASPPPPNSAPAWPTQGNPAASQSAWALPANAATPPHMPAAPADISEVGTSAMPAVGDASGAHGFAGVNASGQWASGPSVAGRETEPPWLAAAGGQPAYPQEYAASIPAQAAPRAVVPANTAPALDELRTDAEVVRRQVATLRDVVAQLREAAQAMEDERTELRGFLDGSAEALDRLEDWAGRHMGLDLKRSPESVRRYLPLSVIWVTTTRLKKLVALLHSSSRSLTATQEEIDEALGELRTAIDGLGNFAALAGTINTVAGTEPNGFSATVAQITWNPPSASASQPMVESRPYPAYGADQSGEQLSAGARAELERAVRDELRRELEDEVRDEIAAEVRRSEEQRLRHELEITVRRQLLSDLAPGLGASAAVMRESTSQVLPQMPFAGARGPRAVQVTSEQSPEAQEVFRDEAQEHLQTITAGIAELERSPGNVDVLQSIRRAMHTLKGAAGMMGFTLIQELAHASEDLLERLADNDIAFTPDVLSLILDTSEALDSLVVGAIAPEEQRHLVSSLTSRYAALSGRAVEPAPAPASIQVEAEERAEAPAAKPSSDLSVRLRLSKLDDLVNLFGELLINRSILEERIDRLNQLVGDTVRASDRLREVGGQLETRFEAATLPSGANAPGMRGIPNGNGNGRAAAAGYGRVSSQAGEFDELELDRYTEFHRLTRGLSEGVADTWTLSHEMETLIREIQTSFARENRLSSDFQDRLLKARLVPLSSLVSRLYRAARATALHFNKEVEFFVEGGETEVDRKVFEEVEGPLLHLVRNAVSHGIESPDVRERAGKPRAGRILVKAAYEGNQVVIAVRDDGAGIDAEKVRQGAIARGLIDSYAQLSEKEAIDFIFRPGYSTADTVTEESGRGVGLDVVRDTATRLRGTIEVDTLPGQGTTFTMKFPISLQIARAVLVKVGAQTLAIPMVVVEQIGRLDYYRRVPGAVPSIEMRGERYPLAHLASYLKTPMGPVDERSSVLLVNAGKHRVALLVDSVVNQQEVVSKPLGAHLQDVPGVAGATVLGNGQVVLILELHELLAQQPRGTLVLPEPGAARAAASLAASAPAASSPATPSPEASSPWAARPQVPVVPSGAAFTSQLPTSPLPAPPWERPSASGPGNSQPAVARPPAASTSQAGFVVAPRVTGAPMRYQVTAPPPQDTYVLVVDDSPSVRRVVSNMLKAAGWTVQTARDGVEALEVIAREQPGVVLLDIEMPRMDGYELMATIRSQDQYKSLPLVVLTSRAASKHQQRAFQLGADAYVVKPYQDEELLNTLAKLVRGRGQ